MPDLAAPDLAAPDLAAIDALLLDGLTKGLPSGIAPLRLDEIGGRGWNVLAQDLPLPLAVLRDSALRHNGAWMRRFLAASGARLAPHGKTSMSPQLFARQLVDGAWAITVATVQQLEVCRRFGFPRLLLANQLIGAGAIAYVLAELKRDPGFDFYCLVDSVEGVALLAEAAGRAAIGRPLQLLLEGGSVGGRTGARDLPAALAVARAVKAAEPHLALRGVEGFEGLIAGADDAERERNVCAFLDSLTAIARAAEAEALFAPGPVLLSAGGSAYYDLAVERLGAAGLSREAWIVTRSGCYLTHDSGLYRAAFARIAARDAGAAGLGPGPRAALEVWAYVQSRPEPGKAILSLGQRDIGRDSGWPAPLFWYRPGLHAAPHAAPDGLAVTGMNDQHTHLALPEAAPLRVGDMLGLGVSHPCTTFDKWDVIPLIDDGYNVVGAIKTFF